MSQTFQDSNTIELARQDGDIAVMTAIALQLLAQREKAQGELAALRDCLATANKLANTRSAALNRLTREFITLSPDEKGCFDDGVVLDGIAALRQRVEELKSECDAPLAALAEARSLLFRTSLYFEECGDYSEEYEPPLEQWEKTLRDMNLWLAAHPETKAKEAKTR
jgi:chromosome segregation ATPase